MSLCEFKTAVFVYRRLNKMSAIARTLELFLALAFFSHWILSSSSYSSLQLPAFLFRRIHFTLFVGHRFVFLLGNLIVVTLFSNSATSGSDDVVFEEFVIPQFEAPRETEASCTAALEDSVSSQVEIPTSEEVVPPEDEEFEELSNDEFQSKVEAFIERQQRFLKQESLSMVRVRSKFRRFSV